MTKRINVILPEETVRTVDRIAKPGNRSRFIDDAIKHYVETRSRASLRARLKEGALRNSARDLAIAEEWFAVDQEAWDMLETREAESASRNAGKSTSRHSTRP